MDPHRADMEQPRTASISVVTAVAGAPPPTTFRAFRESRETVLLKISGLDTRLEGKQSRWNKSSTPWNLFTDEFLSEHVRGVSPIFAQTAIGATATANAGYITLR